MERKKNTGTKYPFEKRRFARIQVNLQIKFRSLTHFEKALEASITNLSLGGMFIRTKQVKPVGTKVEIEIPDHEGRILKINATVRSAPRSGDKPIGMGIMFDNLNESARKFVEYLINMKKK